MRLFTQCKNCKFKIYITHPAKTRQELPSLFELVCSNCGQRYYYNPYDVIAEAGITAAGGAFLGGLLGLALGGAGALAGAILGGVIGKNSEDQDHENVERFNRS